MATAKDFLDAEGKWACTQCGACCKTVAAFEAFPRQWLNKKGGCTQQTSKGKCHIYANRPSFCRVSNTLKGRTDQEIAEFCATMLNAVGV
jgi:Fe-S-cluster containining protein